MNASFTYVTIAGVDVTDYITDWEYSAGIDNSIDEAHLQIDKSVFSILTFNNGDEIIIRRGPVTGQENIIFRGNIDTYSPKGLLIEIKAKDKLNRLSSTEITNVFEDSKISTIATSLIETYGGLTADVEDSGDASIFDRFICNYDKIYERLQTLRKIMNWILYYDAENDKVVFKSKGSTINSHTILINSTGTTNVYSIPKWNYDTDNMVNSITIVGAPVLDWKYEVFSGDGVTKEFTINSVPEHVEIEYPAGTRNTLGILDGKSTYDYTVDKSTKKIIFKEAPGVGVDNIIVNYATYVPVTVQRKDEDSISTYGAVEDTYYYPDILTVADAELKAQEILERFSMPTPTCNMLQIEPPSTLLKPGDQILIDDTINNINRLLTVTRINYSWPEFWDLVDLGQENVQDRMTVTELQERVSKLEKREAQNVDFVNIVVSFNDYLRVKGELQVQVIDTSLDGTWGVGFSNGTSSKVLTWGAAGALWQSTYTGATTTESITHQDDQYEEEFMDTDYVITDETTATIDTTNGTVTF
jgi:hypothetical protein